MVTAQQIKMARSALDWSIERLSKETSVSSRTIMRIEDQSGVPSATKANMNMLITTLEAAGIEFIGAPDDGPGVRLWLHFDSQ